MPRQQQWNYKIESQHKLKHATTAAVLSWHVKILLWSLILEYEIHGNVWNSKLELLSLIETTSELFGSLFCHWSGSTFEPPTPIPSPPQPPTKAYNAHTQVWKTHHFHGLVRKNTHFQPKSLILRSNNTPFLSKMRFCFLFLVVQDKVPCFVKNRINVSNLRRRTSTSYFSLLNIYIYVCVGG